MNGMYNREMGNLLETVRTVRGVELGVWSLELRVESGVVGCLLPVKQSDCCIIILFLDKMVNTILSCDGIAGRRWRREMYGLRFLRRCR